MTPTLENVNRLRAMGRHTEAAHLAEEAMFLHGPAHRIPPPTVPKRIFISGPISSGDGIKANVPRFAARAKALRAAGHLVENPCENFGGRMDLDRPTYLRASTAQLLRCDAIDFLEGWEESPGALWEARVAQVCGIPVYA
jgi:hypothetical protein